MGYTIIAKFSDTIIFTDLSKYGDDKRYENQEEVRTLAVLLGAVQAHLK